MQEDILNSIRHRLAETVAWCSLQPFVANECSAEDLLYLWQCELAPLRDQDPSAFKAVSILRTSSLQPPDIYLHLTTFEERRIAVDALAETRSSLLGTVGRTPDTFTSDTKSGRLVLYDPDNSEASGGALVHSNGFFDVDDAPPWDTWIAFVPGDQSSTSHGRWQSYLLSWVPACLVNIVEAGIVACPGDCIAWATCVDTPLTRLLHVNGLI